MYLALTLAPGPDLVVGCSGIHPPCEIFEMSRAPPREQGDDKVMTSSAEQIATELDPNQVQAARASPDTDCR